MENNKNKKNDKVSTISICQNKVETLVEALQNMLKDKSLSWKKGWKTYRENQFSNYVTGKPYSGGTNILTLWLKEMIVPEIHGEKKSGYYVTMKQAFDLKWKLHEEFKNYTKKCKEIFEKYKEKKSEISNLIQSFKKEYGFQYSKKINDKEKETLNNLLKEENLLITEYHKHKLWEEIIFFEIVEYQLIKKDDKFIQQFLRKINGDYVILYEKEITEKFWNEHPKAQNKPFKSFRIKFYSVAPIEAFDKTDGRVIKTRHTTDDVDDTGVELTKDEVWDILYDYLKRENIPLEFKKQNSAYYSPSEDKIVLPKPGQFVSEEELISTSAHEVCHSTGHKSRLNRDIENSIYDEKYSKEELVAEMGSMFFMLKNNLLTDKLLNNALAYIQFYLENIKNSNSKNNLIYGINAAYKAIDYIYNKKEKIEKVEEVEEIEEE